MNLLEALSGRYEGSGAWYDSTGKSDVYQIVQTNRLTNDGFEVEFKHDFADGDVVQAHYLMNWIAPHLFQVHVSGKLIGHGYCLGDTSYQISAQ